MSDQTRPLLEASLHEGPVGGQKIRLRGTQTWPEWVCVKPTKTAMSHHYLHVAAGVYEYGGACAEYRHVQPQVERCRDCGGVIGPWSPNPDAVG